MEPKITINDFSKYLFWDVDLKTFDLEKHKIFLVGRVLELGQIRDWENIKTLYGLDQIKEISLNLRSLDAVKINKSEFRCYKHRQLVQNYWNS